MSEWASLPPGKGAAAATTAAAAAHTAPPLPAARRPPARSLPFRFVLLWQRAPCAPRRQGSSCVRLGLVPASWSTERLAGEVVKNAAAQIAAPRALAPCCGGDQRQRQRLPTKPDLACIVTSCVKHGN